MNSFSSFAGSSLTGFFSTQTTNSLVYISRYAKDVTTNFSGSAYTDLSTDLSYSLTSSGLNPSNQNTTFARLKYLGNTLKSTDFVTSSSSFTIYMKHAARFSTVSPFNLQYPSSATFSSSVVLSGSSFTTNLISMLDPGSVVPYSFIGCTSADLSGASLTGLSFTAPYQSVTNTFTMAGNVIFPTVSQQTMTISVVPIPVTTYAVTVAGGVFLLNGSRPLPPMVSGNVYLFDQSSSTNIGNTLVFGTTLDSPSYYTTGVVTNGIAGNEGAYTLLNYTSATLGRLGYYSRQTTGMGYVLSYIATGNYTSINTGSVYTVTFTTGTIGSIKIMSSNTTVSVLVVGGGGCGLLGSQYSYGGAGGGGGGIIYNASYNIVNDTTYAIVVGSGGSNFSDGNLSSFGGDLSGGGGRAGGAGGVGVGSGGVASNGGTGGVHSGWGYTAGGGAILINSVYYSGGGRSGNNYNSSNAPVPNNTGSTVYGTGGAGGNGTSWGVPPSSPGKDGVVIITFTLA